MELEIEDFARISERTPYIADMKPGGRHVMVDLHREGGVPTVMKRLLESGLLHGDALTVTGKTVAENLAGRGDTGRQQGGPSGGRAAEPSWVDGDIEGEPGAGGGGGEAGAP